MLCDLKKKSKHLPVFSVRRIDVESEMCGPINKLVKTRIVVAFEMRSCRKILRTSCMILHESASIKES